MALNVLNVFAKLTLDKKDYDEGMDEAEKKASGWGKALGVAGSAVGATVAGTAKALAGATVAAGGATVAMAKQAKGAYAEYEQLAGGVETLFMDSADTVMKYAENAYATTGLSANQYMEQATSFAASLIQATGRGEQKDIDELKEQLAEELEATKVAQSEEYRLTKRDLDNQYKARKEYWDAVIKGTSDKGQKEALQAQRDAELQVIKESNQDQLAALKQAQKVELARIKDQNKQIVEETEAANNSSTTTAESLERAAQLADMAMIDMSDNANKMGTSMESIQNAYQGFAKQNYTINNLMSAA